MPQIFLEATQTNYVITKSKRFKGAISGASEALYRTNYGHDHYQLTWELELGLPWEKAEAWERISPFNQVANITTPTLWIGVAMTGMYPSSIPNRCTRP